MAYGFGGTERGGGGATYPYFDGSFILFLILILLVFGSMPYYGAGYYGADK